MAATIKDIAERAQCGVATVSSYLNGGNVRPENREKIESAIRELHYTVNETARQLKTNRTRLVGAVIPEFDSNFSARILSVISDELRKEGYALLASDCRSDAGREKEAVDFLIRRRVDGLFMIPVDLTGKTAGRFARTGKPLVLIDRQIDGLSCDTVCVDNEGAICSVVNDLVERGHRAIGLLTAPREIQSTRNRIIGYRRALTARGIPVNEEYILSGPDTIDNGMRHLTQLLTEHPEITAVIAASFQITFGAVIAVNEMGIDIPARLSLIGFDQPQFARAVHPRLTIVSQPVEDIGRRAAHLMLQRLREQEESREEELQIREEIWLNTQVLPGKSVRTIKDEKREDPTLQGHAWGREE